MTEEEDLGACVVAVPEPNGLPVTVPGGHHVTLAYFGDNNLFDEDNFVAITSIVSDIAEVWRLEHEQTSIRVLNTAIFGGDAEVAVLDGQPGTSPATALRDMLLENLTDDLYSMFKDNETYPRYSPHLTLGYISKGFSLPYGFVLPDELMLKEIAVWNGTIRRSFSLNPDDVRHGELMHYGILRRSGRYPWGSGNDPYQRSMDFFTQVKQLRDSGMRDADIAKQFGMSTTELRATNTIAKNQKLAADQSRARILKESGMSNMAIGREMGLNESSVRALLDPSRQAKADVLTATADMLKDQVSKKTYVDVGLGTESMLGMSKEKLNTAVAMLKDEGYEVHNIKNEQVGMPGKFTESKVLCAPGTPYQEVSKNRSQIQTVQAYSEDGGSSFREVVPPRSVSSKRVEVRYGPDGGATMDGVIELRPGVPELSLGGKHYAQVRIAVDDSHYLKGMAIYANDLPDGVDIRFNTNKTSTGSKMDAMKGLKDDPEYPFGAVTLQKHYIDKNGKEQLSAINVVGSKPGAGEEGGWNWSKNLSSQMLSKQPTQLAKQQLDLEYKIRKEQYDEIASLTNPAVQKKLMNSFADSCDSAATHLKAAALPGQRTHVILPNNSVKDTEIYAPNYQNGEKLVLIRHPHGGTFEIPELTVNNRNQTVRKLFGNIEDAVVINSKTAQKLSGADFDGDTVIAIPNRDRSGRKIVETSPSLKGLENFDPKVAYPGYPGMKKLEGKSKQTEMGKVSNLITDMTIKGATPSEIARAVRHSMVVIDAEKHELNYKQSEVDNGIRQLKIKYQGGAQMGASTLVSRAGSEQRVDARKDRPYREGGPVNIKTGEREYVPTGETYTRTTVNKRTGAVTTREIARTTKSNKMAETKDAFKLTSEYDSKGRRIGTATDMEVIYATHANRLKALANDARLTALKTAPVEYSPSAKKAYDTEVKTLDAKLNTALKNKPLERQAQLIARSAVTARKKASPDMEQDSLKKISNQELAKARTKVGAGKEKIEITPKEWEAIQSGAISNSKLTRILDNTDDEVIKKYATPRYKYEVSDAKAAMAKRMLANGYTQAEIAAQLGVPASTLNDALNR